MEQPPSVLSDDQADKKNRDTESETILFRRDRHASVISPVVLSILSGDTKTTDIDEEEDSIGEDLEFKIREMGMEIRTEDNFGIIKLMKVFIKGVGPSTLTIDELSWTIRVLDTQIRHALGIARLYLCKEGDLMWRYSELLGVAAITTESNLKNNSAHFLRIVDLNGWNPNKSVIFEQEIYPGMVYNKDTPFFHTFEVDGYMAGFSFADEKEAELFYDKVQDCIATTADTIVQDYLDSREQTTINVGDNFVSQRPVDGTKLDWKKPAPSEELLKEMGGAVPSPVTHKKEKIIDLVANPQPLIPDSVAKFGTGVDSIADGLEVRWRKNTRALAEEKKDGPKTPEECEQELDSRKHRSKRLNELRKNAISIGDSETARGLKNQIDEEKKQIKKLEETLGKKRFPLKKFWR
mmetsp:Transcript_10933/g.13491  ORF Transcript_10933/g.13491 Transcript_10933/m.13491 type:complete len:408 (-) Transcript_10933:37-1260(-)